MTVELGPLAGPRGAGIVASSASSSTSSRSRALPRRAAPITRSPGRRARGPRPGASRASCPTRSSPSSARRPGRRGRCASPPRETALVWIDLTVPRDQAAGRATAGASSRAPARRVARRRCRSSSRCCPRRCRRAPSRRCSTTGAASSSAAWATADAAERQLWTLLHRHRLAALHAVASAADVRAHLPALDGSLYTAAAGYDGPGRRASATASSSSGCTARSATRRPRRSPRSTRSPTSSRRTASSRRPTSCSTRRTRTAARRAARPGARPSRARATRTRAACAWPGRATTIPPGSPSTCPSSEPTPTTRRVAAAARAAGKETWIYDGFRPSTGTMLTDTEAVSLRTLRVDRGDGGRDALVPLGDDRLVRRQPRRARAVRSVRHGRDLPQPRRRRAHGRRRAALPGAAGRSLRGALAGARRASCRRFASRTCAAASRTRATCSSRAARTPRRPTAVARALLPRILAEAPPGAPPAWSERGAPFFEARRALAALVADGGAKIRAASRRGRRARARPSAPFAARARPAPCGTSWACPVVARRARGRPRGARRSVAALDARRRVAHRFATHPWLIPSKGVRRAPNRVDAAAARRPRARRRLSGGAPARRARPARHRRALVRSTTLALYLPRAGLRPAAAVPHARALLFVRPRRWLLTQVVAALLLLLFPLMGLELSRRARARRPGARPPARHELQHRSRLVERPPSSWRRSARSIPTSSVCRRRRDDEVRPARRGSCPGYIVRARRSVHRREQVRHHRRLRAAVAAARRREARPELRSLPHRRARRAPRSLQHPPGLAARRRSIGCAPAACSTSSRADGSSSTTRPSASSSATPPCASSR